MNEQTILNDEQEAFLAKQQANRKYDEISSNTQSAYAKYLAESEKQTAAFKAYMDQLNVTQKAWDEYKEIQGKMDDANSKYCSAYANWNNVRKY